MIDLREKIYSVLIREALEILKAQNYVEDPIIFAGNQDSAWVFPGAKVQTANQAAVISLGAIWYGIAAPVGTIETSRKVGRKKHITSKMNETILIVTCVNGIREAVTLFLTYDENRKFVGATDGPCQFENPEDERHDLFAFRFKENVSLKDQIEEIKQNIRPMIQPTLRSVDMTLL